MLSRFADARILAVDDTPANLELLDALLRRAGLRHIHTLADPRRAMDLFDSVQPDLVLLDLHMPHLDGITLLGQIVQRAAGTYLPVLVLTADTTAEAAHRALQAGAKDFLPKPFDVREVLLRVGNLLETRGLYQRLRGTSAQLARELGELRQREEVMKASEEAKRAAVQEVLAGDALHMVYQPVVDLHTAEVRGFEALARFVSEPPRSPDLWFGDAADVGLGPTLELAAVSKALDALPQLPAEVFLAVNVSPETVMAPDLLDMTTEVEASRLVIELTEHVPVEDYAPVSQALDRLRDRGIRLAVDDTGAGFASLRHILALSPDVIKLDRSLVQDIHLDPARRALAAALVGFAVDTGAHLIAEGIETADEQDALTALGVGLGQGYHLARPGPLPGRDRRMQPSRAMDRLSL